MNSKKRHSDIWLHFSEDGSDCAKCKYCKSSLSILNGSHGNLNRHLKNIHPSTPLTIERQTVTVPQSDINLDIEVSSTPSDQNPTNSHSSVQQQKSSNQHSSRLQQQSISQFIRKAPPVRKVQQIDKQVLKMVAKGHHALRMVEEPEFKKLIHDVSYCPGYNLPTRKTLSNNLLPSTHNEILEDIKSKIRSSSAVSLTTDCWTSRANTSFIAITAHYIDENTNLISYLIGCEEFLERHTAEHLCNFIKTILHDFEISNKVTAIISDNAANIVAAVRLGQWRGIGCFAHTLNLIIQSALREVISIITKVRKIVEYFHRSSQGLTKLRETQKQMGIPELKLKQDVETRWNSTYLMLERIVATKNAVISTLSLKRPDLLLSLEEWEYIEEIIPILKPFYEVTVEFCSENNVTLSKVTVICNLLETFMAKCVSTNRNVSALISKIKSEMKVRFNDYEKNPLYAESTLLDPRFKKRGFKTDSSYEVAVRNLRSRLCTIKLPSANNDSEIRERDNTSTMERSSIWDEYDQDFNKIVRPDNNSAAAIREFDKYLNEEYLERRKDPLVWWRERKNLYPCIYIYVLKRLCILATSVPCERIFSATGQIINDRRTLLKSDKVSSLVFLHRNM